MINGTCYNNDILPNYTRLILIIRLFKKVSISGSFSQFSFRNCKFRVQRCKEGTARVVVWMMGVLHSYTLESSFAGSSEGSRAGTHYSIADFITMGKQFSESLCEYFDSQPCKVGLKLLDIID